MKYPIEIMGRTFEPGTKQVVAVPVTTDLDGTTIKLYVHVITGKEPGPSLALLSTLHGSEFLTIEMTRRFVAGLDPSTMKGIVLAVPVGNPVALQMLTRNTPDEADASDLNRVFPGQYTWIAEQLARVITESVLKNADYLIDFHMGLWGSVMGTVACGTDFDEAIIEKSHDLAFAFGYPSIQSSKLASSFPGPRSACGYAGVELKIPNMIAEIGGAGFDKDLEESWLKMNTDGIRNVMVHVGMLPGVLDLPEKYLVWEKRWRVNPSVGGYLLPEVTARDLMCELAAGQLLGRVVSPYTFEVLEELRAPGDGILFYAAREYPVRPGDWAFGVIDAHHENTHWVKTPLKV